MINVLNADVHTTHKSNGPVVVGSLQKGSRHVPDVTRSVINETGCKAGTRAKVIYHSSFL